MNYNTKQSIITCTPTLINRCADNKKKRFIHQQNQKFQNRIKKPECKIFL